MNKRRERMDEDIETVNDRRASGSSLIAVGLRAQF